MPEITVNRNWKKKIDKLCENVNEIRVFCLGNGFSGETAAIPSFDHMKRFVTNQLTQSRSAKLKYDKETGLCGINVHSNLWYTWVNKIDW